MGVCHELEPIADRPGMRPLVRKHLLYGIRSKAQPAQYTGTGDLSPFGLIEYLMVNIIRRPLFANKYLLVLPGLEIPCGAGIGVRIPIEFKADHVVRIAFVQYIAKFRANNVVWRRGNVIGADR